MREGERHKLIFFLGGMDLEMETIRELLVSCLPPERVKDKCLRWGAAKTSRYREEISDELTAELIPVLIELEDDCSLDPGRVIFLDHHGERAGMGRPTSLHQVFSLLDLPAERWTRWYELVAANDRGYVPGMLEVGASIDEVRQVRAAERRIQGITPEHERMAELAIRNAEEMADGTLTVVRLEHSHTATVTDRLEPALGGPGYQNLLILSPGEVNFYGPGKCVEFLAERFGGVTGGALPERGFWVLSETANDEVVRGLLEFIEGEQNRSGDPGS
jgi:hypothetical protein